MAGAVKILLGHGASLRNFGERKQTALHKAATTGNFKLVEMVTSAANRVHGRDELKTVRERKVV